MKYALICIYLKKTKCEYWIKPGSKFFFHCVHILDEEKNYRGIYGYLLLLSCKSEYTANCLKK